MWRALVAAVMVSACGDAPLVADASVDTPPDVGVDAYACRHPDPDAGLFGEPCIEGPLATECHGGLGWCINGVCRPQCVQPLACLACEGSVERFSSRGACYCSPD